MMHCRPIVLLAAVAMVTEAGAADWAQPVADGFSYSLRAVNSATRSEPVDSSLNPDNALGVSRYRVASNLRADLRERLEPIDLLAKPRLDLREDWWHEGPRAGDSGGDTDGYLNEWRVRVRLLDDLAMSYGRENLQWGPSYLLSPSNPFSQQNGRNRPKTELPGSDFARAVWTPSFAWTISAVVNTAEGRQTATGPFRRTAALKMDRIMERMYASVIASKPESGDPRAGLFGTWNATEGLVLYAEGSAAGHDAEVLVGQSYTFEAGPTLSTEYFYNDSGEPDGPIEQAVPPVRPLDSREVFLRRHYALFQYLDGNLLDRFDLTLRWTVNLDDRSHSLLTLIQRDAGDHAQLFVTATLNGGDSDTEFASIVRYSAGVGVELFF